MSNVAEMLAHGWQYQQAGQLPQAEQLYRQVLQADPDHARALLLLGTLALQQGNLADAVTHLQRFVQIEPHRADAFNNLGIALANLGRSSDAIASFQQSLRLRPNNPGPYNNLALALFKQGKFAAAAACWRELLRLLPDHPQVHNSLGIALAEDDHLDEAVEHFFHAIRLAGPFPEAHSNLALALVGLGRFEEAAAHAEEALRLRPGYADASNHLGLAILKQGRLDEALRRFDETLRFNPEHAGAHKNRAITWLLQGDYARGWPEFEWRWQCKDFRQRHFAQPAWDGSPLAGRTILLYAEQGLGDTLQFLRYAPLVKQGGGTVLLECPTALHRLLAASPGVDRLLTREPTPPAFDVHAALLSLPALHHTTLETIPVNLPYVFAEPALVEQWRTELSEVTDLKVGVIWQGSPKYLADRQRSIPLACFAPLARVPGVRLFSLQKRHGTEQLGQVAGMFSVTDLGHRLDEGGDAFVDTAAVMMNLDMIVTSDTAAAHLAGALGVRVWMALPFVPDWRWVMHREICHWYPQARLFRQKRAGDWAEVFERIARELLDFSRMHRSATITRADALEPR